MDGQEVSLFKLTCAAIEIEWREFNTSPIALQFPTPTQISHDTEVVMEFGPSCVGLGCLCKSKNYLSYKVVVVTN